MMKGQQGYEQHLLPPTTKKGRENEHSEQSKSGTKKCARSEFIRLTKEATVSAVTIRGGSLFHTSITRIARIFTLEVFTLATS